MPKVVSICFEGNTKKYFFRSIPGLSKDDYTVVETQRGLEIGRVVEEEREIDEKEIIGELKGVIRKATEKDLSDYEANKKMKPKLYSAAKEIIDESGLDMKLLEASYTLDRTKLVVYFAADGRVDFRELVRTLAARFHTRIELRQVGPRDASRIISGLGICGREVCCASFLGDCQNVSVKMAKNQKLSLNPQSISGLCGKLLCCIAYEDQEYTRQQKEEEDRRKAMEAKPENDEVKDPGKNEEEEEVVTLEV